MKKHTSLFVLLGLSIGNLFADPEKAVFERAMATTTQLYASANADKRSPGRICFVLYTESSYGTPVAFEVDSVPVKEGTMRRENNAGGTRFSMIGMAKPRKGGSLLVSATIEVKIRRKKGKMLADKSEIGTGAEFTQIFDQQRFERGVPQALGGTMVSNPDGSAEKYHHREVLLAIWI